MIFYLCLLGERRKVCERERDYKKHDESEKEKIEKEQEERKRRFTMT